MSIIMDNARKGILNQYELSDDAACVGDLELAREHWQAAELLEDLVYNYFPCLDGEL